MRFYAVGEYGEKSERPHYHVSAFGLSPLEAEEVCAKTWNKGFYKCAEFTGATAQYLCGYINKGMVRSGDFGEDRIPEFSSKSPGLGKAALEKLIDIQHTTHGADNINDTGDVFRSIKIGGAEYPLGRYLLNKLRDATFGERYKIEGEGVNARYVENDYRTAILDAQYTNLFRWVSELRAGQDDPWKSPQTLIMEENVQHGRNVEARQKIKQMKRIL